MSLQKHSPLSQGGLSAKTLCDVGGLTLVVDAVEQSGLVKPEWRADDRRSVQISITSTGIHQTEQSLSTNVEQFKQILDTFSKREVVALVSSLQRLSEQLQEFVSTLPSAQPRLMASKLDLALAKKTRRATNEKFDLAWLMCSAVIMSGMV